MQTIEHRIADYVTKKAEHIAAEDAAIKARKRHYETGTELGKLLFDEVKDQIGLLLTHNGREVLIRECRPHHSDKSVMIPLVSEKRADGREWGKRMVPLNYTGWDRSRKTWDKLTLNEQTGRMIFESTGKPQE